MLLEPAKTVSIFQANQEFQRFAAGETIFQQGELGNVMYGIIEGEVDIVINGKVLETIHAGDVFGEGALVQPEATRASNAVAKTDCKLACLDKERFLFVVQETPMFALHVMRSYSNRLRKFKQQF
ncbi:putative transcriptional regulator, Crp/Fnr family [Stanieria cyanosphaera PCC 7437]|uniref:Transcriptional regulator, Crp/Fnr family n=1 Tax=Stanieria cyanosphaera (strain ATCC 29371 / PCC 7437) TaxID=111780 RepID=K9XPP7_STAC7|nr:cyclic nucleotide-binding domain-containing protein [Stanieria cyanosphaera]AFZ34513.1 putative transcriptional regulator, Crp/Fnr family [Stanieria cyanosphaera PCC 7437]